MKYSFFLLLMTLVSCSPAPEEQEQRNKAEQSESKEPVKTLTDARNGHKTKLIDKMTMNFPAPQPPAGVLELVEYSSPVGSLKAYISKHPLSRKKRPAIVWLTGGFSNSIGDTAWANLPKENDQSASVFWKSGIITMYPSLRGGNRNPGYIESFYGEVDDVISAVEYLKQRDDVDPDRIYLGGHSTGGTLALLVAASCEDFRAVFSFGPIGNVARYGQDKLMFNVDDPVEKELRGPAMWLHSIKNSTFVIEGTKGNIGALNSMRKKNSNSKIHFIPVEDRDHFEILSPVSQLIVAKIVKDISDVNDIRLTEEEVEAVLALF